MTVSAPMWFYVACLQSKVRQFFSSNEAKILRNSIKFTRLVSLNLGQIRFKLKLFFQLLFTISANFIVPFAQRQYTSVCERTEGLLLRLQRAE